MVATDNRANKQWLEYGTLMQIWNKYNIEKVFKMTTVPIMMCEFLDFLKTKKDVEEIISNCFISLAWEL